MKTTFKDISDLKSSVDQDPQLKAAFTANPVETLNSIGDSPLTNDCWIYRIVVISLGTSILVIISGVIFLVAYKDMPGDKTPTILTAIGSAAIGALSGLLAPSPNSKK
jgi:hypothetical protein